MNNTDRLLATERPVTPYDAIAEGYVKLFSDEASLAEDKLLFSMLEIKGKVLDIGCGNGLLLDHVQPERYVGIDPSTGMLRQLSLRHRKYSNCVLPVSLEEYIENEFIYGKFDTIVCLYGTASYIQPWATRRIVESYLADGGNAYFMYFKDGYTPVTHVQLGISLKTYPNNDSGDDFGNFKIVTYEK